MVHGGTLFRGEKVRSKIWVYVATKAGGMHLYYIPDLSPNHYRRSYPPAS